MKALVLAAALAAIAAPGSTALAGATAHEARIQPEAVTTTVMADAGRLGSAGLTALNGGTHWAPPQQHQAAADEQFAAMVEDVDTGTLLVAIGVIAFLLARPLGRLLRRQEQQRRATALASTLHH
jgi:hypothetical protein